MKMPSTRPRPIGALLIACGAIFATPSFAEIFRVGVGPDCTHATFDAAIVAATANGPGDDSIYLSPSAISLTSLIEINNQAIRIYGGLGDCTSDTQIGRTTLTRNGASDAFWVHGTANTELTLSGVDIVMGPGAGRGLLIDGPGTTFVVIDQSSVSDGQAADGGNIWIAGSDSRLLATASEFKLGNATVGNGGGIYCESGASVEIRKGSELHSNTAVLSGGGIFADGCTLRIASGGDGDLAEPDTRIFSNTATTGNGGGIAATSSLVELYGWEPGRKTQLRENTALGIAGSGGGLWLSGSGSTAIIYNSWVDGNRSHLAGGGALVDSGAILQMGVNPVNCGSGRRCSKLINNVSEASGGGGVAVLPGGYVELLRTEISGNYTGGGGSGAAAAITGAGTAMVIEGCEIFANFHAAPEGTESPRIFAGPSSTLTVAYTTIVENLVAPGMAVLQNNNATSMRLLSSIVQASRTFTAPPPPATQVHCLIAQEGASLPLGAQFVTYVASPADLFRLSDPTDFAILRYSEAQDYCDTSVWSPWTLDMDGQDRGWDDGTFSNIIGPYDLGADEWRPEVFAAGFESGNLLGWSAVVQ